MDKNNPPRINVLGWYGHKNIGDNSYCISFPQTFPEQTFEFQDLKAESGNATCIMGGGDILNELYVRKLLAIPAKRRYAISISSNINSPLHLLKELDGIWVRDLRSLRFLQSHGIACTYMPDVSTCLQGSKSHGEALLKQYFAADGLDLYNKRIGIVFNAYLYSGKSDMLARDHVTFSKVVNDLGIVLDNTPASFVFFPMSTGMPHDDRVTNSFLANRCKFWKKNCVIYDRLSVPQTLDLIAACDVVISSRLHASIFAMNNAVPFIDITHHDKNRSFLETIGYDQSISYWNFDQDKMKTLLKNLIEDSSVYKEKLRTIHQAQMAILQKESSNVPFDQS